MDENSQGPADDESTAFDEPTIAQVPAAEGRLPTRPLALPVYRPGLLTRAAVAAVVIAVAVGAGGYALTPAGAATGRAALGIACAVTIALVAISWRGMPKIPWPFAAAVGAVGGAAAVGYLSYARGSVSVSMLLLVVAVGTALGGLAGWAGDRPRSAVETQLAGYRIEGVLGAGASGTVYRALDAQDRRVAIKVLAPEWLGDVEFRDRLRAEATVMRSLEHPNCVRVYNIIDTPDFAALVTEYVDGATLKDVLAATGRLTGPQAARVMSGALRGLAHVHERAIIHRDVKPANIAVDRQGRSRLLDYGIARRLNSEVADQVAGTPAYMSPEQAAGEPLDRRSDIYACGAVLFELLTGRRPFPARSAAEAIAANRRAAVPDPAELQPDIHPSIAALVVSALAKQPAQRPQTADEFRQRLEEAAERAYGGAFLTVSIVGLATLGDAAAPSVNVTRRRRGARRAASLGAAGLLPRPATRGPAHPRWRRVGAGGAVVVAIAGVLAFGFSAKRHVAAPRSTLASCLIGTWVRTASAYDDVWDGSPVLVRYPGGRDAATIRYAAGGRYTYVAPADGPTATGTLKGAAFLDKSYGVETGRWHTVGAHKVFESSSGRSFTQILYAGYEHTSSAATALQSGVVAEKLACSGKSYTVIDDFTYRGKRLTSRISYRREHHGIALPSSSSLPNQHNAIGGVNLDGYCRAVGGQRATSTKPLTGTRAAIGNWVCLVGGRPQPINMTDACQWTNPAALHETARPVDPSSALSWLCYGDPAPAFRIKSTSRGAATTIDLSSVQPCPSTTTGLSVDLVPSGRGSPLQGGRGLPLPHGGQWHTALTVGPFGADSTPIPAQTVQVEAYCQLPHNLVVAYRHESFRFTGRR